MVAFLNIEVPQNQKSFQRSRMHVYHTNLICIHVHILHHVTHGKEKVINFQIHKP